MTVFPSGDRFIKSGDSETEIKHKTHNAAPINALITITNLLSNLSDKYPIGH